MFGPWIDGLVGVGRATGIEGTGYSMRVYCQPCHESDARASPFRRRGPIERGLGAHVRRQRTLQLFELASKIGQVLKSKSYIPTPLSIGLAVGVGGMRRSTAEPRIGASYVRNIGGICPNRQRPLRPARQLDEAGFGRPACRWHWSLL